MIRIVIQLVNDSKHMKPIKRDLKVKHPIVVVKKRKYQHICKMLNRKSNRN